MRYITAEDLYPHLEKLLGLENIRGIQKLDIHMEIGDLVIINMQRLATSNVGDEPVELTQQYKLAPMENINESKDNADRKVEEGDRTK